MVYHLPARSETVPDIKLKDLRYLVAVADTRHFGRAAERCFVSQPTLSAQLKKLELSLGVQLIERQPNNVALTEAGEQIVGRARRILEACAEVTTLARSHRDPLAGTLRVALLPTIGPYLLPHIARPLQRALPRLELHLYEYQTAPMSHPLSRRARLREADLDEEDVLLLEDGHCLRDQALAVCSRAGLGERQDFRATSLETLRHMVATGAGITLLPQLATEGAYGNARGVVALPFAKPVPSRRVGAVWRKSTARRLAIEAVCDVIAERIARSDRLAPR